MAPLALAILLVVILITTVSVSLWRMQQKRWAIAVMFFTCVLIVALILAATRVQKGVPAINTAAIELHLSSVNPTGAGWRITGDIVNGSDMAISQLSAQARVDQCIDGACTTIATKQFELLMHVRAGQQYPFRVALHDISLPEQSTGVQFKWHLKVLGALGYAGAPSS